MDSISQIALGSAVSLLVTRGQQPKKAILYGAIIGTLPDLDVLTTAGNDLQGTIEHRTWSHSWIVATILSPGLAWMIYRFDRSFSWTTWLAVVWLTLITHSALDALTAYGTDIFWPFGGSTIMLASIFIIDPLFTLPLLIGIVLTLTRNHRHKRAILTVGTALALSVTYLFFGLYAQYKATQIATDSLNKQGIEYSQVFVAPTPFNSIVWRILAIGETDFFEGYYSLGDTHESIDFINHPRGLNHRKRIEHFSDWQSFDKFTHGYNQVTAIDSTIVGVDIRLGAEGWYMFRFKFAELAEESDVGTESGEVIRIEPELLPAPPFDPFLFGQLWERF